jgi:hypothetical protein
MEYFNEPEFLDPADWNLASYTHHPVDDLEPLPDHQTAYRDAALECMKILRSVDAVMSRATDPRLAWTTVSIAILIRPAAFEHSGKFDPTADRPQRKRPARSLMAARGRRTDLVIRPECPPYEPVITALCKSRLNARNTQQ